MNDSIRSGLLRSVFVFGTAGLLLTTNACLVGPKYQRPSTPAPPAFKGGTPADWPSAWKEAQPNDAAIRGQWWLVYNDPQLNALEDQVRISNQNVLAADAQFRAAKATVLVSRAGLFPTVSTSPTASRSQTSAATGARSLYAIPIDLAYQVDTWGSIRRGVAGNSAIAEATAAQLEVALLLYQSELAADYFQIQGLEASRRLVYDTVKSYERYVQLTQDRYDGGVASMGDVALAQTQLETTRVELVDLGVQRAQFEHAIAVLTGRPPSELSILGTPAQGPPPVSLIGIPSSLLERRPDVAAAERQVAAANEQIGIAKAAFYPALAFSASAGSQTAVFLDLLSWPSRFWSLGPQLAQTLFDGGRRRAQVKVTQANYDATVANYRQTVLTSFQQVEDNLAQLRLLAEESVITDRAVKAAQRSLQISTDQYRGGLTNYLTVITSQTFTLQNQLRAVDIQTRRMDASVSLIQALGGGWDVSLLPSPKELRH